MSVPQSQEWHRGRETLGREDLTTVDDRHLLGLYDSAEKTGEANTEGSGLSR